MIKYKYGGGSMKKIGFIGAGVMGRSMIKNFLKNGISVDVYTRTMSKASDLVDLGANLLNSIEDVATSNKVIITMVGFPEDIEEVYLSDKGILNHAKEGSYLIDMTTTKPQLVKEIYDIAKSKNLHFLDAPVSGSDVKAESGTLTIMVGGDKEDFDRCYPIFKCIGNKIIHEGKIGSGQQTKMANQIAIAGAIAGVCEALYYAKKVGLDENKALITISSGAAQSFQMDQLAPRILDDDFDPGFFVKHFIKDMKIAIEETQTNEFSLPILEKVLEEYLGLEKDGGGDFGTHALYKFYEKQRGCIEKSL